MYINVGDSKPTPTLRLVCGRCPPVTRSTLINVQKLKAVSTETNFKTVKDLSVSDFGRVVGTSKDSDGKFRSFGVRYGADTIWVNDEKWYEAWTSGTVVPKSIEVQQVQRRRYKTNDQGERVIENGRPVLEDVTEEIAKIIGGNVWTWEITKLKTKSQLQGEDDMEDWMEARPLIRQTNRLEAAQKYHATATKAAETAVLSADQQTKLDAILAVLKTK